MTALRRTTAAVLLAGLAAASGCDGQAGAESAAPAPTSSPAPPAGLATGEVILDFPVDEAKVKRCEIFRGRANLPADKTIVIGVRNRDNGNSERYFEAVTDWEYPEDLDTWTGAQWFGSLDSAAGQSFRVEVLVIDLALAEQLSRRAKQEGWHSPENPPAARVAAHIDLHRVKGKGPAECS
jgi:hypothetical protein